MMGKITKEELYFDAKLQSDIRERFCYVERDQQGRLRCFFENSGGSLRLKAAVEAKDRYERIPDCPERAHAAAAELKKVKADGMRDIMEVVFGAKPGTGALVTELTASQAMFQIVRTILENAPGTNAVTTSLEHPSAYDSVQLYCRRTGKQFRVAQADPAAGGVAPEDILRLVDRDTALLSVMSASNISGFMFDMDEIVSQARKINPEIYIVSDAVQHMPHGVLDVDRYGLDGCTFAPYKAFGIRGCGYGYVSDRVAAMEHHKLLAKPEKEWELGTFSPANYAAVTAVVDYVCWLGGHFTSDTDRRALFVTGMEHIHLQEHSLLVHMMEGTADVPGLRHIPGVRVCLDSADDVDRDLISAIDFPGADLGQIAAEYYRRGVTVFERVNTSLYSKRILESLGLTGVIRVSPLHCHHTGDIEQFLRVTAEIAGERTRS